jgi:hypothetical protein
MSRWSRGQAEIDQLLNNRELQKISGAAANGGPLLDKAIRTLTTAAKSTVDDPDSAYVLAYDAARYACAALLAQQGLRSTTRGGHYAVERAVRAQFGDGFRAFGILRRRRNELEYAIGPGDSTTRHEAEQAIQSAQQLIAIAKQLLPSLRLY